MRISIINSTDSQETGVLETNQLLSELEMAEKLIDGKNTPLSECIPESEVDW